MGVFDKELDRFQQYEQYWTRDLAEKLTVDYWGDKVFSSVDYTRLMSDEEKIGWMKYEIFLSTNVAVVLYHVRFRESVEECIDMSVDVAKSSKYREFITVLVNGYLKDHPERISEEEAAENNRKRDLRLRCYEFNYPMMVIKEGDDYVISYPDLDIKAIRGRGFEETRKKAEIKKRLWIDKMVESNQIVNEPFSHCKSSDEYISVDAS